MNRHARNQKINEQCREIVEAIIKTCNDGEVVSFEADWGGNSLTVQVGAGHTHVGNDSAPLSIMVDELHGALTGKGPHLSFA